MLSGDHRTTPERGDLALDELEGVVAAPRYVEARAMRVIQPRTGIHVARSAASEQVDQLLFGEMFDVGEFEDGRAWGRARRDGYVGYVDAKALSADPATPTHWVSALRTFAFSEPSIRSPAWGPISLNALVRVEDVSGAMALAAGAGWIPKSHLCKIGRVFEDPAAVAERFVGTPYLWGGRDSIGLDCSGLIQQALYACGRACPRDSDQQAALGAPVSAVDLKRGDLVFWRGHVGMMVDERRLVHANGHHMEVTIEPLADAERRIVEAGVGRPTSYRRPHPAGIA
jgi:hypothetical protein